MCVVRRVIYKENFQRIDLMKHYTSLRIAKNKMVPILMFDIILSKPLCEIVCYIW